MTTNEEIIEKAKEWCKEWNYYLDEEDLEEEGYKLPFGVCNDRAVIPLELLEEKLKEARASGYDEGYSEGHMEGYNKGYSEGNDIGYEGHKVEYRR
jgi:flagellar biosynthesis/type III secretory pathway protein FliH